MANYLNDTSGHVPGSGTCSIWDGNSHATISPEQVEAWKAFDNLAIASGIPEKLVKVSI
jgi:hypothetical protein